MDGLAIGRIVWYRSKTGGYDLAAIVTATTASLNDEGVRVYGESEGTAGVPPLSSDRHVHLTVLTPGVPIAGPNSPAVKSGVPAEEVEARIEAVPGALNLAGSYQEWDIPFFDGEVNPGEDPSDEAVEPTPGTWRWPERA